MFLISIRNLCYRYGFYCACVFELEIVLLLRASFQLMDPKSSLEYSTAICALSTSAL
jgi:hypothetical protein